MVFEQAKWIKFAEKYDSVYARNTFSCKRTGKILLRIVGLGFYKVWINGRLITENLYNQPFSNYLPRDLSKVFYPVNYEMSCRIYYSEFVITDFVRKGENQLLVMVGNGWFRCSDRFCEGDFSYSKNLQLIYEIEENGKTVAWSDGSLRYCKTFLESATLYNGEIQNFSLCKTGKEWIKPEIMPKPEVPFYKYECESDKIVRRIKPKVIFRNKEYTIYDCRKNITGYMRFLSAAKQESIQLEYSEEYKNGDIVPMFEGQRSGQSQKDLYKNVPKNQKCETLFTWYGFRYVKVKGRIKQPCVCVVHSGFPRKTKFSSSNKILNWYYDASILSIESNLHQGIQMDCPHRERYGYTGDGQISCDTVMYNFETRKFYEKWLGDIADSQDKQTGYVQHTAPYMGGGGGPAWGIAIIIIPWQFYKYYHDANVLEKYRPNMLLYLRYLAGIVHDGIVTDPKRDLRDWLGDWSFPDKNNVLPAEFVTTYYLIKGIQIYTKICDILHFESPEDLGRVSAACCKRLIEKYYNEDGSFCGGKNGADAFAIDIGLGNAKTLEHLCKKYNQLKCFDTGIYGTKILLDVLSENYKVDLIYELLSSTKYPSFGWWKEQGATSLWEDWSGYFFSIDEKMRSSQNHLMFAASQKYLFEALLGIRREQEKIIIRPYRNPALKKINGFVKFGHNDFIAVKVSNKKKYMSVRIKKNRNSNAVLRIEDAEYALYSAKIFYIKKKFYK